MLGKKPWFFSKHEESAPEPEPATLPTETTCPVPSRSRIAGLWVLVLAIVFIALLWLPSFASVALLAAALLICPSEVIRQRILSERVLSKHPTATEKLSQPNVRYALAGVIFFLGCIVSPKLGQLSVASYLDLQLASVDVVRAVEYSKDPVETFDYVTTDGQAVKFSASDEVDATSVGVQPVTVELAESAFTKRVEVEMVVQDTQAPRIVLAEKQVQVELGTPYDIKSNIKAVTDPVDGALKEVSSEPKSYGTQSKTEVFYNQGWYLVKGNVNTNTVGTNTVLVRAIDRHGNETSKYFQVEVVDPLDGVTLTAKTKVLEYSKKTVDANILVTCSDADTKVTANNQVDLSKVGNQEVSYTLNKGKSERVDEVEFEIRDTKSPTISLASDTLEIDKGGSFDPYANITSVNDDVDGALPRVDTEPDSNGIGWYTITGSYDVDKASKYFLTVVACDCNGNRVTKEFSLKVNNPPVASTGFPTDYETGGKPDPGTSYVINTNTGKFHYPSCRDVKRIAAHNRWDVVMTRDEVVAMGYVPCKHCNP